MKTDHQAINELHQAHLYLHFYDELNDVRTRQECQSLIQGSGIADRSSVLDAACGHGRHALQFSRMGYEVSAIDLNSAFLALGRQTAQEEDLAVDWIQGDMIHLLRPDSFQLIYCLYNSFGFLDTSDAVIFLSTAVQNLRSGGILCLDIKNGEHPDMVQSQHLVYEKGLDLMIDRMEYHPEDRTITNRRIYIKDGIRVDAPFKMQLYNRAELSRLAMDQGLNEQLVWGSWDREPFSIKSKRIIAFYSV